MHVDRWRWSWDMKSTVAKGTVRSSGLHLIQCGGGCETGMGDVLAHSMCRDTEAAGSPKRNHQRRLGPEAFKSHPSTPGQVSGRAGGRGRTLKEAGAGNWAWNNLECGEKCMRRAC